MESREVGEVAGLLSKDDMWKEGEEEEEEMGSCSRHAGGVVQKKQRFGLVFIVYVGGRLRCSKSKREVVEFYT